MQGYNLLADTQPDARTARLGSKERHENALHHLRQDSLTIISNRNDEIALVARKMSGKTDIRNLFILHGFLRILQQINQHLFYLRTIHQQPLVSIFYLIMEYRIRIKMLQISHQITNPYILKLRFRYALQLSIVLYKLQQAIASSIDGLQCHQQIIMLQRILLHPFT